MPGLDDEEKRPGSRGALALFRMRQRAHRRSVRPTGDDDLDVIMTHLYGELDPRPREIAAQRIAISKRSATLGQLTTFHHASM